MKLAIRRRFLALFTPLLLTVPAWAQQNLRTADGTTSIVDRGRGWTLSFDVKDSGLGVAHSFDRSVYVGDTIAGPFHNFSLVAAAQAGKRDLFASGDFVPGLNVNERLGYRWTFLGSLPEDAQFVATYVDLKLGISEQKTATVTNGANGPVIDFDTTAASALGLGGGVSWWPSSKVGMLGLSGRWGYSWDKSEAAAPSEVCKTSLTGVDSSGNPVTISDCSDRFVGRVNDAQEGQIRFDWASPRWDFTGEQLVVAYGEDITKLPPDVQADVKRQRDSWLPAVGLLVSTSMDLREHQKPRYNAAIGPILYRGGMPDAVIGALLFEFTDFTETSPALDDFSDIFSVRLYVGLPFR